MDHLKNFWKMLWRSSKQTKQICKFDFASAAKGPEQEPDEFTEEFGLRPNIGLVLGPLLFIIIMLCNFEGLAYEAKAVLACTCWIATWWICETIPIPATSLLPILLLPATKATTVKAACASYADPIVYLFLGGFIIALAIERVNLHRRIALKIIQIMGDSPSRIILGFMVATGFLSMWISNTACAMMMVPIGLAVITQIADLVKDQPGIDVRQGHFNFGTALMLGIAYSASLGGVGTIIGTPPNAILVGIINTMFNQNITFFEFMMYGVPVAWIGIICAWFILTRVSCPLGIKSIPGGMAVINEEYKKLGKRSYDETVVAIVFAFVAIMWIIRGFVFDKIGLGGVDDTVIAIVGAVILFLIPSSKKGKFIMDWKAASKAPFGILLLFGGGLSIAGAFSSTGLTAWIGGLLQGMEGLPIFLMMLVVTLLGVCLTEVTSNTATCSMLMPIMASMAIAMNIHPYTLMISCATACSFAFLLPVATPPNAVVFGSGYVTIPQMVKAGIYLEIPGVPLIASLCYFYLPIVWGIDFTTLPQWAQIVIK
ncbi:MAG: SLC13/DASS family transporter [Clostridia bacterium]|nr:SLC13/DASS family transporter [Clostridia bacterium]